ncbi:heparan-alpha-glucosaminide N-acetyltransferase [Jannaschia marina]|uniref:heparan-alpha-glucosaminide N-acetyltransferase n=1 Tax=Jannaschia marina TaxID=2741674 RepID=UPI0015CD6061|nr:heparan-alpha-glucosaminide N-acetyltransferase [Jannaschia marina]
MSDTGRLIAVDWLRSLAIVAMVLFHFGRDFEVLGLVPPGTTFGGLWNLSARLIAGSFLFLAGFSLWLGHGAGLRPRAFLKRLAMIAAGAAAITIVTYFAVPGAWVRFGILHSIALCSLVGLLFLRAHAVVTITATVVVLFLLPQAASPAFDHPLWIWTGLSTAVPPMIDYEPLVPWFAPFAAGLAFGQAGGARLLTWGPDVPGPWARRLAWPGRHALAIYLIHQPVLVGLLTAAAWVWFRLL